MSLKTKGFCSFADFRLDPVEKVLLRDGGPIPLTPKVFDTLQILVEKAGHLVEKDELMRLLWQDRYVEEGNLTSNVKMLRRALGDDAAHPRFIETVPRRGYRFIAEVHRSLPETQSNREPFTKPTGHRSYLAIGGLQLTAVLLIILIVGFGGIWYARSKTADSDVPLLINEFSAEKLSTNGKAVHAIISPDGKNVIYTNGIEGKQSVWLRQLADGSNTQIIPPSSDRYDWLEISPDGDTLFFARRPQSADKPRSIYRLPLLGGVPKELVDETEGWMSVAADGTKISFVRCPERDDEFCSLWIADAADGKNQKKVASRSRPIRIGDNQISADGKSITFAVGQSQNSANEFGLAEVDIETASERKITPESFFNIKSLVDLPDRSGLLMTASRIPNKHYGIWFISRSTGKAELLTRDSENYHDLSLDSQSRTLVATQVRQGFRLVVLDVENPDLSRNLSDASRAAFAPDGRILYSSLLSGNDEIWSINSDGVGQRQLTNNPADEGTPLSTPDNKFIFFASNRTGASQIWRMNADGSDQMQITKIAGGTPIYVSPDGEWLLFHHALDKTLWRVPAKGGEAREIASKRAPAFAISPDGTQAAYFSEQGKSIEVISLADSGIVKSLSITAERPVVHLLAWMPAGNEIAFISAETEPKFILRSQPLDGLPSRKIADLGSERINSLSFAPDGKNFTITQGGWQHDAVLLRGLK